MTFKRLKPLAAALAALGSSAGAEDRIEAFYPEGPITTDAGILFAEMHKDRIVSWNGVETTTFYESAGCGPTAIALYGEGYAVLCHLTDEIHVVSPSGDFINRIDEDAEGRAFINPNDASADGEGGVYFSASGIFNDTSPPEGALLYFDVLGQVHRLVDRLHYANGVYVDTARKRVYVSEHLAGRIITFSILAPGQLGKKTVFKRFGTDILKGRDGYRLTGPDGLEGDADGDLFVAIYGAGKLVALSPQGEILAQIDIPEPLVTNAAIIDDGAALVVTGSEISPSKPFPGSVRKLANPLHMQE